MTVHGHHAARRGDMMRGEVNMMNSNAASEGGKRNGVIGIHANATRTHTVRLSGFDTGDERSCAAVGALRRRHPVEVICVHS